MKKLDVFILALLFFATACAGQGQDVKKPGIDFGNQVSANYPSSRYLTATGIGRSEEEARRQAKAELSSVFESRVYSDTFSRVQSVIEDSGAERVTRDAEHKIRVVSSVQLQGMEIGETWFDKKQKVYYALAVLNKNKAREEWQGKIDHIDDSIEAQLSSLDSVDSAFAKLRSLVNVRKSWLEREVFVSRLRVLGFQDASLADYDIRSVISNIHDIKSSLRVFVDMGNDEYSPEVSTIISERLSAKGYIIGKSASDSNVVVSGSVRVEPVEINNPDWKFARAIISASVVDVKAGVSAGEVTGDKRAAHLTYSEAAHKAVKDVSRVIADRLLEYFEGAPAESIEE